MSHIAPLRLVGDKGFPNIFLRATPCTLIEHQLCASPHARHGSREASVSAQPGGLAACGQGKEEAQGQGPVLLLCRALQSPNC